MFSQIFHLATNHSFVELPSLNAVLYIKQIDAAINSGNSGGPALQDDKVIGIAFETLDHAENIGYIIPVSISITCIENHHHLSWGQID